MKGPWNALVKSFLKSSREALSLKGLTMLSVLSLVATWGYHCYSLIPRPPAPNLRHPSSLSDATAFLGGGELIGLGIYEGMAGMATLTIELIKPLVIRSKLHGFLDDLPLDDDVRQRVNERVDSERFMNEIVPFLLSVKDLYLSPDQGKQNNFRNYIMPLYRKAYEDKSIPGLEHTLFSWQESDSAGSAGGLPQFAIDKDLATKIVNLYDVIFLQEGDYHLGMKPTRNMRVIERTVPVLKEFLQAVIDKMGGGDALGEVLEGIHNMMEDPHRMETLSISLIDFITQTLYKHHQMFTEKSARQLQRRQWMLTEIEKDDGGQLWDYLMAGQKKKRRIVQYVVDGLQGHLTEALSKAGETSPFLQQIYQDHLTFDRLPLIEGSTKAPNQSLTFLELITNQSGHGHNDSDRFADDLHYLPYFKSIYRNPHMGIVQNGVSTTPTISVRNIPIAQTGAATSGPGSTGLPNFHFIERSQDRAYYFYGNDSLLLAPLTKESGMKNLFERIPQLNGMNCMAPYDDGTKYFLDGFYNLAIGEKVRDFGETLCLNELEKRGINEKKAQDLRQRILNLHGVITSTAWYDTVAKSIQKQRARRMIAELALLEEESVPDYFLMYSPWTDHFAHFKGPFSDEIISPTGELSRLDYWLGRIHQVYQKAGVLEDTVFGMAGDHGLTPVYVMLNPEDVVFKKIEKEKGYQFKIKKISSDEGEGPKLTHPIHPPSMKGYDVIVASTAGGNYMMDFFIDQGDNWTKQPLYKDLLNLRTLEGASLNIVDEILNALDGTLEYLVVRETANDLNQGVVKLLTKRQGQLISGRVYRLKRKYFYESAQDILGIKQMSPYKIAAQSEVGSDVEREDHLLYEQLLNKCFESAQKDQPETWCDEEEWLNLTSYTSRPDSVVQVGALYDNDRAGTINLFPKAGIGYNTKVPGRHAGEDFHEKDAFAGFWGAPLRPSQRIKSAVIGQVPATLFHYLTDKNVQAGEDGWGYSSVLPKILPAVR